MSAMASQITTLMIVYSTVYWGTDQRKHQSSASTAFVRGIHRWPVNSPHKGPVTRETFPFDDVIMRTHVNLRFRLSRRQPRKSPGFQSRIDNFMLNLNETHILLGEAPRITSLPAFMWQHIGSHMHMQFIFGIMHIANTLRLRQISCHFVNYSFKLIFLCENCYILIATYWNALQSPINDIPESIWIPAWCRTGDKLFTKPMIAYFNDFVWFQSHCAVWVKSFSPRDMNDTVHYKYQKANMWQFNAVYQRARYRVMTWNAWSYCL